MVERDALVLGALLHDIGKFWQRSGIRRKHEHLGADFLDLPVIRNKIEALVDLRDVQNIISDHHESGVYDVLVRIAQIADRLASGERRALGRQKTQIPWETPLKSVFAQIYNRENGLSKMFYPTRKLVLNRDTIFPCKNVKPDYDSLWQEFLDEAERLPNGDFAIFFEALLNLLKKYTWCVPSAAYKDHADISLFDHSKVTAAIAWCLYALRDQLNPVEQFVSNRGGDRKAQVATLVGGDISGIQSFIYAISSDGAAKSLRGRSVFLNLLSDAVVGYAMRQLGNPPICNLIYSSGGHFYFLTSVDQAENISRVRKEISEHLFDAFGGEIYCGLEAVTLVAEDFQREMGNREGRLNIGDRWAELMGKLGMGKRQKFGDLMRDQFNDFFEPLGTGKVDEVCTVCHVEISPVTRRGVGAYTEDNSPICSLCHSFEQLGDRVRRSKYLMTRDIPPRKSQAMTWGRALEKFGRNYRFTPDLKSNWDRVYTLDNTAFLSDGAQGFRFVGKAAPIDQETGSVRDFSHLADASEGIPRWGLLRMDIDNLGKIFSEGLGDQLSLSRITTLSSMISLFFEGYVNTLCETTDPDRLYVIYTGGDDSFIVGSWDAALDFVQKLQTDFRNYTCGNPKITLSAALTLEARKYPLYKAANRCGEWLDGLAKNHTDDSRGLQKDSFAFLGQPVFWRDFGQIERMKKLIVNLVNDGGRGLLQRLMSAYNLYDENKQRLSSQSLSRDEMERLVQNDRWRWRLAYSLAREAERSSMQRKEDYSIVITTAPKQAQEAERSSMQRKEDLKQLQTMIFDENFIKFLDLATRWSELATRKRGE